MESKKFSRTWKKSKQPRKQRKYVYNAPLHLRQNFMHSHLSKELREQYKRRTFRVARGDTVKVLRGEFKGLQGKVDRVDLKRIKVYIQGIEKKKKDGTIYKVGIHPSNLMIITLNLDDKKRREILERAKR